MNPNFLLIAIAAVAFAVGILLRRRSNTGVADWCVSDPNSRGNDTTQHTRWSTEVDQLATRQEELRTLVLEMTAEADFMAFCGYGSGSSPRIYLVNWEYRQSMCFRKKGEKAPVACIILARIELGIFAEQVNRILGNDWWSPKQLVTILNEAFVERMPLFEEPSLPQQLELWNLEIGPVESRILVCRDKLLERKERLRGGWAAQ